MNALWITRKGRRGKALSDVAKEYREHVKKVVQRRIADISAFMPDNDGTGPEIYGLECTFYFQELEASAWFEQARFTRGKKKDELKVKLRYKRIDVDNRLKFLQDWFTKCIGLNDDSNIFEVVARKSQVEGREHVKARMYRLSRVGLLPPDPKEVL